MTRLLTYLTALLILITRRAYRCDGDLIKWEVKQINGHNITMIRWMK